MNTTADTLRTRAQLEPGQVRAVRPGEHGFGRKLEPEGHGITRTAIRAHIILGLAGLVIGFFAWLLFYFSEVTAVTSSPGFSVGAFLFFGAIAGLLLGGLITARPDHQIVIQRVKTAAEEGQWSLIIHPQTPQQCEAVLQALQDEDADVVRTV